MTNKGNQSDRKKGFFDFVDEVFTGDLKSFARRFKEMGEEFQKEFRENMGKDYIGCYPLMNIIEDENSFRIDIAAPGLNKDSFKISLDQQHLKVAADLESTLGENEKYRKREFYFGKFKRTVKLPEEADLNEIEAKYEEGVLKITVAKQKGSGGDEREIKIS